MTTSARLAILLAAAGLALAAPSAAQQRRLLGHVKDTTGKPVAKVKVTATSPDISTFKVTSETNAKGEFVMMILAESVTAIKVKLEKEGFVGGETDVELHGLKQELDFTLTSQEAAQAAAAAARGPDAAEIHNAGAELARNGDWKGAQAKFEEALKVKEDLHQSHAMLAVASFNLKEYDRAEKAARRSLELNPTQPEIEGLLADALDKLDRKAEAQEIRNRLAQVDPKLKAVLAYNRGAELDRERKEAEALAAFEEAIASDPTLTEAYYNAGMLAYRLGEMERSRTHLTKYLEIDPAAKGAENARLVLQSMDATKGKSSRR